MRLFRLGVFVLFALTISMSAAWAASEPLQVGDRGDEVQALQEKLSDMGYIVGSMDGVFGDMTEVAVKEMQKDKKLTADGKVSPELYRMLIGRELTVSRGAPVAAVRRLVQTSLQHVGVPYWFGGTTPRGFDCSGFTRYVFSTVGVDLPRMADSQFGVGRPVATDRLQPGDLVFFETYESGPSHVGIYIGNSQFISATSSRGVKVDDLFGYYWGERYIGARRVL